MGGTKGSHLVIDNKQLYDALGDRMVYYEHIDGRICIVFRFMDKIIMGSTDIRIENPDDAECDADEVDYMMTTLQGVFPNLTISKDDVVFTFCGVRPLFASGLDYTSRVSRSHKLEISAPDDDRSFSVYSMIGGKLTTFRAFAEQAGDKILAELGKTRNVWTEERPYLGAVDYPADDKRQAWIDEIAKQNNLTSERVADLFKRFGTIAKQIASQKDPAKHTPLKTLPDYSVGEIEFIAQNECIRHLSDLARRRSIITLLGRATEETLTELADITGQVLNWDESTRKEEVAIALKEATDGR
jgi:glycerol-3-phosphate dehydrogenase